MKLHPLTPAVLSAAALLALAGAARAQVEEDREVHLALATAPAAPEIELELDDASVEFAQGELGGERVVKGAPYCADAVHESIQTLADGNRIVRRQQTGLCRDGEGRTRQEVERDGRKRVWLRDPVSKQAWLLDPARKTARRLGGHGGHAMWFNAADLDPAQADAWRAYADRAREQAREAVEKAREQMRSMREATPRAPGSAAPAASPTAAGVATPAAAPVVVTRSVPAEGRAGGQRHVDIQVLRLRPGEAPTPLPGGAHAWPMGAPAPVAPPLIHWQAQRAAPRGPGVTTVLGSKDIEGVRANGERTSWTIEAGKIGNEKPIQIVREVWTSPDLLLTVLSRDADPRSGETVYRLVNLKRGEPDAALMKVPADYAQTATPMPPVPTPPATPRKPATPSAPSAPAAPKG